MTPEDRAKRARAAVQAFNAMLYGLNGYVRALAPDKNLRVEVGTTTQTTGGVIYIRPPMALGDQTPHQRSLCDKRDPVNGQQRCKACAIREHIMVSIYHEIAHNVFGSFVKPDESVIRQLLEDFANTPLRRKALEKYNREQRHFGSYMDAAGIVSEFMPTLLNALEDSRIDEAMFQARPGVRAMNAADVKKTFVEGLERADGSMALWKDAPLNSQVMIGLYLVACGHEYQDYLHKDVVKALDDAILGDKARSVKTMPSIQNVYTEAFPILDRLKELGFCREEGDEPEPEPEPEEQEEENDEQADEEPSEGEDGADDSDLEPGDSDQSQDDPESGDGGAEDDARGSDDSEAGSGSSGEDAGDPDSASEDRSPEAEDESPESDGRGSDSPAEADAQDDGELSDGAGERESESEPGEDSGSGDGESSDGSGQELSDAAEPRRGSDAGDEGADAAEAADSDSEVDDEPRPEMGTPEQVQEHLTDFTGHEADHSDFDIHLGEEDNSKDVEEIAKAVVQGKFFDTSSKNVDRVNVYKLKDPNFPEPQSNSAWARYIPEDIEVPESVLGPILMRMRRVLSDNQRASFERHLKSGRINQKVLGKRAWNGDPRLFQKKRLPGKKSYAVLIGLDISGSTVGLNNHLIKRAAMAQADVCQRLGVDFAVYAHTADAHFRQSGSSLDMYHVKDFHEPWDKDHREGLLRLKAMSNNLDGHTLEYYRKEIERTDATDKIILYYTDGKMPASNYDEELGILKREIRICQQQNITLAGVGIRTNSPTRHGLQTVQVDTDEDLVDVMDHLEKVLLHRR